MTPLRSPVPRDPKRSARHLAGAAEARRCALHPAAILALPPGETAVSGAGSRRTLRTPATGERRGGAR